MYRMGDYMESGEYNTRCSGDMDQTPKYNIRAKGLYFILVGICSLLLVIAFSSLYKY